VVGIYCIKNNKNNKVYIGQSVDIEKRKTCHFYKLTHNIHENGHLQNSFNKYGSDYFSFSVISECLKEELNCLESKCIEEYNSCNPSFGYNLRSGGANPTIAEETKYKLLLSKAMMTIEDVSEIKNMLFNGIDRKHIMNIFSISKGNLDAIAQLQSYAMISSELNDGIFKRAAKERQAIRESIIELLNLGFKNVEISKKLNISTSIIEKTKKKYTNITEIQLNKKRENYDIVMKLKNQGEMPCDIAKITGISQRTVCSYFNGKVNPYNELSFTKATKEVVAAILKEQDMPEKYLCEKFDISRTTLSEILYIYKDANTESAAV